MENVIDTISIGFDKLKKSIGYADKILENCENSAVWDSTYVNSLPNMAFAVVEKGYKEGDDKRMRHLPHHDKGVKSATENNSVDLSHFRNALSRVNQVKSVSGSETDRALRKRAASHLEKHRSVLKASMNSFNEHQKKIWNKCEELFISNIRPLLEK
jgi:hypothetical protein